MIPTLLLLLCGMHRNEKKGIMTNEQSVALGGVCSIYIMLWHIEQFIGTSNGWFKLIWAPGSAKILINGLFFFLSGYGLMKSKEKKGMDYMSMAGLIRRLSKICIPAYMVYLLSYYALLKDTDLEDGFFSYILGKGVIKWIRYNDVTWFIIELFILYAVFWLLFSGGKKEGYSICILVVLVLAWTVFAYLWGRGLVWYASTLCFPLGIIVCKYEKKIEIKEYYTFLILLVAYLIYYSQGENIIGYLFASNIASISFCFFIYQLCSRHYVFSNIISCNLGKIRYELYLTHVVLIKFSNTWGEAKGLRIVAVIICSIIIAAIIYAIKDAIQRIIKRYIASVNA